MIMSKRGMLRLSVSIIMVLALSLLSACCCTQVPTTTTSTTTAAALKTVTGTQTLSSTVVKTETSTATERTILPSTVVITETTTTKATTTLPSTEITTTTKTTTINITTEVPVVTVQTEVTTTVITNTSTTTSTVVLPANPTAPDLGEAARFLLLAQTTITNGAGNTYSNGDIGLSPAFRAAFTGFTAGVTPGELTQLTNGLSYAADDDNATFPYPLKYGTATIGDPWATTGAMLTEAIAKSQAAYTFLGAVNTTAPNQACPGELGTLTLTRGVYVSGVSVLISTGALTLDAQGDANSVWIFNITGDLTTDVLGSIVLANGAQAKNVYWRVSGITTIAASTTFYGNVFDQTQINVLGGAQITGRLHAQSQITFVSGTGTNVTGAGVISPLPQPQP